ncbi:MAG: cupin domain-containing protein [Clostridia bacterium]|nr:cupin domain-containing protein [Clostridia bacterium]
MKVLITADEIKNRALRGERLVSVGESTIITPAARDIAREMGVELLFTRDEALTVASCCNSNGSQALPAGDQGELVSLISRNIGDTLVRPELVERIVKEVLAVLGEQGMTGGPVVEKHKSGLRLVRGDTVTCEPFSTGNPRDRVFLRDLLPLAESPNMCAGFMTMENSAFEWELKYDEYDYVIDGELEIIVDGQTYLGKPGDVFFIPRGTRIIFSSPGKAKFLYVTYPANWSGQA